MAGFDDIGKTNEDQAFKEFGSARGKRDGTIGGRRVSGFVGFGNRNDVGDFPQLWKITSGPRKVEDMKKEVKSTGGKIAQEWVSDAVWTRSSRRRQRREAGLKLRKSEGGAERRVVRTDATGRANFPKESLLSGAVFFGAVAGKSSGIVPGESVCVRDIVASTRNKSGGLGLTKARNAAEESEDMAGFGAGI